MMYARATVVLLSAVACLRAAHPEASRVLILVNDVAPAEDGTGGKGASVFVGEYYAQQRGVPASQILHLNIPLGCCDNRPTNWDSWNMGWDKFDTTVRQPVKKFLADQGLTNQIDYIVPTYGVPVRTWDSSGRIEGLSVDSFLASLNSGQTGQFLANPYNSPWNEGKLHFRNFQNPFGWKMYLVSRLDGPSATIAAALVDKAIRAEANLKTNDGIAYFDYRHIASTDPYYFADQTVVNAHRLADSLGYQSVFNDNQLDTAKMIHNAPKALWAWGWYSGPTSWDGYEFVDGAVGAQLTSYSANNIRGVVSGAWVPLWLTAGITATWGATAEPYSTGYANGDNLFHKFWSGYNFAESGYLASPFLNHAMVFVGDPLYAPRTFQPGKPSMKAPLIASAGDGLPTVSPGSIASIFGAALSLCTATNRAATLPTTLCGTSVTIDGQAAPIFYVSPAQLNVLVPRGITPGRDARIVVTREDGESGTDVVAGAHIAVAAPGIFTTGAGDASRAIVQNSSYSLVPLKPGDAGILYATGLGPVDRPVPDTAATPRTPLIRATADVKVWIDGVEQNTIFAGLTPNQFGLYQINFVVDPSPAVSDTAANYIWLTVDGVESAHTRIALTR